jgi:hypothetical protein
VLSGNGIEEEEEEEVNATYGRWAVAKTVTQRSHNEAGTCSMMLMPVEPNVQARIEKKTFSWKTRAEQFISVTFQVGPSTPQWLNCG